MDAETQYRELVHFSVTTASSELSTPNICYVVAFKYDQHFQHYYITNDLSNNMLRPICHV